MAEQPRTENGTDECTGTGASRGPSLPLLIVGLLALALSVWALVGPSAWPAASMIPLGWIVVGGAIVVGLTLVLCPSRNSGCRRRGSGPS